MDKKTKCTIILLSTALIVMIGLTGINTFRLKNISDELVRVKTKLEETESDLKSCKKNIKNDSCEENEKVEEKDTKEEVKKEDNNKENDNKEDNNSNNNEEKEVNNDQAKGDNNVEKENINSITNKEVKSILEYFRLNFRNIVTLEYDDGVKIQIAFNNTKNKSDYSCSNLNKIGFTGSESGSGYYSIDGYFGYCDGTYTSVKYNDINTIYKNMYGANLKKDNIGEFYYDKTTDSYLDLPYMDGVNFLSIIFDEIKDYSVNDNKLVITLYEHEVKCMEDEDDDRCFFDIGNKDIESSWTEYEEDWEEFDNKYSNLIKNKYEKLINTYKVEFKINEDGTYTMLSINKN